VTKLFKTLTPEAREVLIRDDMIEILTVIVSAVPDPDRPDDRLSVTSYSDNAILAKIETWADGVAAVA